MTHDKTPSATLRKLLRNPEFLIMPCCYDALTAKLIQDAGFSLTFMSGFAVSATRLGLPDTGLISYGEMATICRKVGGCQMANMVEHGKTPVLPPKRLAELGYKIAAYPLTILSASIHAMKNALSTLKEGKLFDALTDFKELQSILGFTGYDETLRRLEE